MDRRADLARISPEATNRARIACAIAVALLCPLARIAHAQSTGADVLFNDGNRLMAEGKIAEACDAFESSNKLEPTAGTLIRLGDCREQNHQVASAWLAYKAAVARVKDARKRELASAKVAALEPRLSRITVLVPAVSQIAELTITRAGAPIDPSEWNVAVPLDGGDIEIAASAPGHLPWHTTVQLPSQDGALIVEVPRLAPIPPPVVIAPTAPPVAPKRFTTGRKIALGAAAASVGGAVAGVLLGASAERNERDAFARCPNPSMPCDQAAIANRDLSLGNRRALQANIALGASAACAVAAAVLWFTTGPDTEHPRGVAVTPLLTTGDPGVAVMTRF